MLSSSNRGATSELPRGNSHCCVLTSEPCLSSAGKTLCCTGPPGTSKLIAWMGICWGRGPCPSSILLTDVDWVSCLEVLRGQAWLLKLCVDERFLMPTVGYHASVWISVSKFIWNSLAVLDQRSHQLKPAQKALTGKLPSHLVFLRDGRDVAGLCHTFHIPHFSTSPLY